MNTYPNPCDECQFMMPDGNCRRYKKCPDWLTWFRWHWKQFNLYAKKHGIKPTTPPTKEEMEEANEDHAESGED